MSKPALTPNWCLACQRTQRAAPAMYSLLSDFTAHVRKMRKEFSAKALFSPATDNLLSRADATLREAREGHTKQP